MVLEEVDLWPPLWVVSLLLVDALAGRGALLGAGPPPGGFPPAPPHSGILPAFAAGAGVPF